MGLIMSHTLSDFVVYKDGYSFSPIVATSVLGTLGYREIAEDKIIIGARTTSANGQFGYLFSSPKSYFLYSKVKVRYSISDYIAGGNSVFYLGLYANYNTAPSQDKYIIVKATNSITSNVSNATAIINADMLGINYLNAWISHGSPVYGVQFNLFIHEIILLK